MYTIKFEFIVSFHFLVFDSSYDGSFFYFTYSTVMHVRKLREWERERVGKIKAKKNKAAGMNGW